MLESVIAAKNHVFKDTPGCWEKAHILVHAEADLNLIANVVFQKLESKYVCCTSKIIFCVGM